MNKGRTGVDNFALSKPTWEIMKIIWEITDFCWELIFGAIFGLRTSETVENGKGFMPPLNRLLLLWRVPRHGRWSMLPGS